MSEFIRALRSKSMNKLWRLSITMLFFMAACAPQPASVPLEQPTMTAVVTKPTQPAERPVSETELTPAPQTTSITLQISANESKVTYEVGETFLNDNNRFAVAIGTTSLITGEVYANPSNPLESTLGEFSIDISAFKSDNNRRDNTIRSRFLQSSQYPLATFVPRSISGLPESYSPGQPYSFDVLGDLTVKQTTKAVNFAVTAQYDQDTLTGSATTTILMSDFGVGPISIAGILNTEDQVKITFDFVARR
jgi:polyisoprenoid-binding protein YceI